MKKLTNKYKKYLYIRARYQSKRVKRYNSVLLKPATYKTTPTTSPYRFVTIVAPEKFTLRYEHAEKVLKFISEIKEVGRLKKSIYIELKDVKEIGEGAIAMMLSVINELTKARVLITGSKPKQPDVRSVLECSGFFKFVKGFVSAHNRNTKNTILRTGHIDTRQSMLKPEIRRSMETVWGKNARCPELFGGIGEMMRNSCDHAFNNTEKITWHLGLSHIEDENVVKFSFVDNGNGIIRTYRNKGLLGPLLKVFNNNATILREAFRDGIKSRTGLKWRGKGLPTIFEMYSDGIITSLVVITNNVYLDFDREIFTNLDTGFAGTYYFWKVNNQCKPAYFEDHD